MSQRSKSILVCGVSVVVVAFIASAVVLITGAASQPSSQVAQTSSPVNSGRRNLSLQPEASRVARQLGKRFGPSSRSVTAFSGQLSIVGNQQPVNIIRRQTESGEVVELRLSDRALTWNAEEGGKSTAGAPTDSQRLLLERLSLDSPDNFVLAQVRGASYFTVARNVRPADASDGYTGPLWNLVRVDEPQGDEKQRPHMGLCGRYRGPKTESCE